MTQRKGGDDDGRSGDDGESPPLVTPDRRYLVVRGRLWRASDPSMTEERRQTLVDELMSARREVRAALGSGNATDLKSARSRVDAAKVALGERGPVCWSDGAPDQNRKLARNSTYAEWYGLEVRSR